MKLEIEEISALRSFVFLWCGSGEGLDLGRMVTPSLIQSKAHIKLQANSYCVYNSLRFFCGFVGFCNLRHASFFQHAFFEAFRNSLVQRAPDNWVRQLFLSCRDKRFENPFLRLFIPDYSKLKLLRRDTQVHIQQAVTPYYFLFLPGCLSSVWLMSS